MRKNVWFNIFCRHVMLQERSLLQTMKNELCLPKLIEFYCFFRFWMAVENMKQLKKVKPDKVQDSAKDIYNLFIVPSAKHAVRIDSTLVRKMESHLSDEQDDSAFFEAQIEIYQKMEEKYYRKFVISEEYVQYICQLESALDLFRTQGEQDPMLLNWSDGAEGFDQQVGKVYCDN